MRKYGLFMVLAVILLAPAAFAATASSANTDNVTANVIGNCRIATFTLAFGAYDPVVANNSVAGGTDLDTAQAAINVFCTNGVNPSSITIDAGLQGDRSMIGGSAGTDFLFYEIYSDAARTTLWNTVSDVDPDVSTNAATALTAGSAAINAYGRVFQDQYTVTVGAYADTVQATVNF